MKPEQGRAIALTFSSFDHHWQFDIDVDFILRSEYA
jgi:hypothetical protein